MVSGVPGVQFEAVAGSTGQLIAAVGYWRACEPASRRIPRRTGRDPRDHLIHVKVLWRI
jgi:hypothetical protein